MSKKYIITQEELDMLEAIRLSIYNTYVEDDSIDDIITASNVTQPLWSIINKKREPVKSKQPNQRIDNELYRVRLMADKYKAYLAWYGEGGAWKMSEFMNCINDKVAKVENMLKLEINNE